MANLNKRKELDELRMTRPGLLRLPVNFSAVGWGSCGLHPALPPPSTCSKRVQHHVNIGAMMDYCICSSLASTGSRNHALAMQHPRFHGDAAWDDPRTDELLQSKLQPLFSSFCRQWSGAILGACTATTLLISTAAVSWTLGVEGNG